MVKIVIVDDSPTFREGLKFYLEKILFYHVIAEASNGEEFLQLKEKSQADLILMDVEMPLLNGIEATKIYLNDHLKKVIAITSFEDKVYLTQLIETGFKGCINKKNIYHQLKNAVELVMEGQLFFPETIKL